MNLRKRTLVVMAGLLILGLIADLPGKKKDKAVGGMAEQKRIVHVLNRLTFGPRPGDVQHVAQLGIDAWIEQQLHPEKVDDSALEARLAPFRTLRMSTRELVDDFPPSQVIRQVANGRAQMPSDPTKRAVYAAQLQRYEDRKQGRAGKEKKSESEPSMTPSAEMTDDASDANSAEKVSSREKFRELLNMPPDQRLQSILKMPGEEQHDFVTGMKGARADRLMDGMSPQEKETLMSLRNPERVVIGELMQAKLLRAIYGERQLEEVMTDFWMNHFNVFINKGADRFLVTSYERDAIRPHALGRFEDLLLATAKSPAMLFYLDNWMSVGPNSEVGTGVITPRRGKRGARPIPANVKAKLPSGLNENYGRELMELHTLSVNGAYNQKDVTEVAKIFTGWSIEQPRKGGEYHFAPRMHEPGDKVVLGHKIKENGEKEGLEVLHLLATHPKTAHFISQKLAMRFVADDPPSALVDRMAGTFLKKHGDIREVLRTMFQSPEFWAPEAYRAKVKTPFEFVVSAVRASGAQVDDTRPLINTLNGMGMMPYGSQPPTGYSMKASAWVNSSALLSRMNFALGLSAGKVRGVSVDARQLAPGAADAQGALIALESSLLGGDVSKQTHETIAKQLDDPQIAQRKLDDAPRAPNVAAIAGLILGSPEFQRR